MGWPSQHVRGRALHSGLCDSRARGKEGGRGPPFDDICDVSPSFSGEVLLGQSDGQTSEDDPAPLTQTGWRFPQDQGRGASSFCDAECECDGSYLVTCGSG